MGHVVSLDLDAFAEAAQDALEEIAEDIAADARAGYAQHELKTADPRHGVIVESSDDGTRVVTYNSFAHFDEFGGSDVRSRPTGAMRVAAAKAGRFKPE